MLNFVIVDKIIKDALLEDIPSGDISTDSIIDSDFDSSVELIAKENGILSGLSVFERVFILLGNVSIEFYKNDGDSVKPGDLVATLKGSTKSLLTGERIALNLLQRMSGVATLTNKYVKELEGTNTKLLDTRKTTPNLRLLEKYSVKIGGGENHRFNLSDGVMLKDNHIAYAGGIKAAVEMARKNNSFVRKIEVETENLDMVKEALEAKADIIMLDNMSKEDMIKAVKLIDGRALTECSGNVTLETIKDCAETGVDYISVGALTHSYKCLDLSMKNLKRI